MKAEQLLEALRPHLERGDKQLVVDETFVAKLARETMASKSAPELYAMVREIGIVMQALGEQSGGEAAVKQLRTGLLEPVLAAVVQRGKSENAERAVRAKKKEKPGAMERPKAGGVRARRK